MATTTTTVTDPADFLTQQNMASKRESLKAKKNSDLEDHEKIYLLKREIDDLRSQIKDGNNNGQASSPALGSTSSSSTTTNDACTGFLCSKTPMLGLFVFVGIALLTRWGRRRGLFTTSSMGRSRRRSNLLGGDDGEGVQTIQFELQDTAASRDVYQAPDATVVQFV